MNRAEIFFDAITNIREELVEEALGHRFRRRVPWGKYAGWAACLALVVCVGWFGLTLAGGGMGGGSDGNGYSSGSSGAAGDTAPQAPEGGKSEETAVPGDSPEVDGSVREAFQAVVLEVGETSILVEPLAGESVRNSADQIRVPTGELEDLPALEAGDVVRVAFDGNILESYPAQLGRVYSVELAE